MAKTRSIKSILFQLLDEATTPSYVLDSKGCLLFANQAMCGWLDVEFNSIVDLECKWTTESLSDPDLDRVRGLSVPPNVFAGTFSSGKVFRTAADGHLIWREAQFCCLDGSSDVSGSILVSLERSDCSSDDQISPSPVTPIELHRLLASLRTQFAQVNNFDHFVGVSPQAKQLGKKIEAVCQTNANVLIAGNSGTGRESLARAIFAARAGQEQSLTPIHGSVADAQLIQLTIKQAREESQESEIWILLLDADCLSHQSLQELGGFLELPGSPLRFISTCTNVESVDPSIANHLAIQLLSIPTLQERKSDIPVLAELLLKQASENANAHISEPTMQMLVDYDWPENLNELKRTIDAAAKSLSGDKLTFEDLPEKFHLSLQAQQIGGPEVPEIDLSEYLSEIEAELIARALQFAKGNKAKACKLLGISRAKLGRRMQQLKIGGADEPIVFEESEEDE